jgi:ribosomal protein S18 acetylase RimI-like enzyme
MSEITNVRLIKAGVEHVNEIAPLFDAYRQFYEEAADAKLAHDYIEARLKNNEATIFLALGEKDSRTIALGFTLLYPTFCSVAAKNVWVLYDLFVTPDARRTGVAKKLMNAAKELGQESGAAWLKLETAHTNKPGQALYESLGWEKDEEFYTYSLSLN